MRFEFEDLQTKEQNKLGDIVDIETTVSPGPPTGPGGRPPGLFATHAQWAGGRPFRFSARAGWAGVVLRYMPGRAPGGWAVGFSTGRPWASPGFLKFYREPI